MDLVFSNGKIEEFIKQLDAVMSERVDHMLKRLEICGHELRMPHSKSIGNGLFELRIKGSVPVRVLYAFHNKQVVLLHIFIKKRWSIPRSDIEYAQNILKQYLA